MVTLSLAFKETSAGTHSPRLPWGRDTPVPDHTALLGSVSITSALLATVESQGDAHRQKERREKPHINEHAHFCHNCCFPGNTQLGSRYPN